MPRNSLPFQHPPRRLCILRLSAIGDVTHMVPVTASLKASWPGTDLTWVVGRMEHRLLAGLPGVRFVVFDKKAGVAGYRALWRELAGQRFDALVHAQVSMRANLASLGIRAGVRLGYDSARSKDLHGLCVDHRIPPAAGQHVLDSFFSFAETLGAAQRRLEWNIPVSEADEAFAADALPGDGPVLVISPCSSHELRNWLPDRYARVADHAARAHGFRVVLCGGPSHSERAMGGAIETAMETPAVNLVGKDTLKQLLAMLRRASLVISPDSGPMHMATAAGTPVIGLHAASNPDRSGPYLSRRWCVNRYDDAARQFLGRPAGELPWGTKIEKPGVMELIGVEDVVERIDAFVAAGMPRATPS
ncbi:MAG: glycosyltransferase family 9 protein [Gammaproteobacteria bacterium]